VSLAPIAITSAMRSIYQLTPIMGLKTSIPFFDGARQSSVHNESLFNLVRFVVVLILSCGILCQADRAKAKSDLSRGEKVYQKNCASCHDANPPGKASSIESLKSMSAASIDYALSVGKMQTQGASLTVNQRRALMSYLAPLTASGNVDKMHWEDAMSCTNAVATDVQVGSLDNPGNDVVVGNFGFNKHNHRNLSAAQAGLTTSDFSSLELSWVIAFPNISTMRGQAAIVGNQLFLPVADARSLYAIDISARPCLSWVFKSDRPLRSSASYGVLDNGRKVVFFGDSTARIHAIDADTGELIWRTAVGQHPRSLGTGTPIFHGNRVYAPVSQYEISIANDNRYLCCKSHGAVVALDAATGAKIWTSNTLPDAKPVRDRGDGQAIWGPSGAPVWTSPAIDEKRGLLYIGTGEATSEPAHKHTDAVLALDLTDGSIRWSFQATANDIYLERCFGKERSLNCAKDKDTVYRDVDFGASMIIAPQVNGTDLLLAGQKSGTVWALDLDREGELVWRQDFGLGSALGGIHWGMAYNDRQLFVPVNRTTPFHQQAEQRPGLHSLDPVTGEVLWSHFIDPACPPGRQAVKNCWGNRGLSGAVTVIDGAVVSGSLDGMLRAFDAQTGKVLFEYDTVKYFSSINGVKGYGGAIDNASIVAANGLLFVNSGYATHTGMPGNIFMAFKPKLNN